MKAEKVIEDLMKNVYPEPAETKTVDQIAAANRDKIWAKMVGDSAESDAARLRSFAYENEGEILDAAKRLAMCAIRIEGRMAEVRMRLRTGCIDGLNTCGILQSLNHDLDADVTKIKTLADNRKFYQDLLK